jgi:hypothetical protein
VARNRANTPKTRQAAQRPRLVRQPRPNPALAGAALIPQAVGSAAGAVRDLSDSNLIVRLTRGSGWIAVLCVLLGGIVALNVLSLSLNAGSGRLEQRINEVERANSGLRAELAEQLSSSRIAATAPELGFYVPNPDDVGYLTATGEDLEKLLRLLRNDTVLSGPAPPPPSAPETVTYAEPLASTTPSTTSTPTESIETAPAASTPAPTTTSPPPTAAPPTGGTGGVGL